MEEHDTAARAPRAVQTEDERIARMGTGSIPRLLTEFAIPAVAATLINGLYNLIDAIFLGQAIGAIGLSATQVAMPIMTVFMALSMLVGAGGNAFAALKLGEGNHEAAERSLGNTVTLSLVLWLAVCVVASIPASLNWLLSISSATDEVRPYAAVFLRIICYGFIFQCVGYGVNNFIRTAGQPNRALVTMVIGACVCIAFNYLFVMRLHMGVAGSALATIVGQGAACVSVLWYFLFTKGVPLKLRGRFMKPVGSIIAQILALGTASFIIQVGSAVLSFATNFLLVKYGTLSVLGAENALACIGLAQRAGFVCVMPLIGVSIAAQPLLGFNYGARLFGRVRITLRDAALMAFVLGLVIWILVMVFVNQVVKLFGITDAYLMSYTATVLRCQILFLPFVGAQIVGSNYFQATGQPVKSAILSMARQILFLLPLMFILPLWLPTWTSLAALDGVYIATPVSDVLAIVLTLAFDLVEVRRLRRREAQEAQEVQG